MQNGLVALTELATPDVQALLTITIIIEIQLAQLQVRRAEEPVQVEHTIQLIRMQHAVRQIIEAELLPVVTDVGLEMELRQVEVLLQHAVALMLTLVLVRLPVGLSLLIEVQALTTEAVTKDHPQLVEVVVRTHVRRLQANQRIHARLLLGRTLLQEVRALLTGVTLHQVEVTLRPEVVARRHALIRHRQEVVLHHLRREEVALRLLRDHRVVVLQGGQDNLARKLS